MATKIIVFVLSIYWLTGQGYAQSKINVPENYYQLIEAPSTPEKWDAWRNEVRTWRDSTLKVLSYKGENYQQKDYKWAASAYSTLFLMANDRNLYDKAGRFAIDTYLKKYEDSYGGVDVVVLWPTYPQLGFDNRTQYSFYRNLPGGVSGLKQLCNDLHRMGKKLMIAYNPWDNVARNEGKTDEDQLLELLKETGADGVYLDTISNVDGFFQQMQRSNPGAIFQSEIPIRPDVLNQVHQSWLEVGWAERYKNMEFAEVPALVRNRWLEQRHMIYRLSRFSHEQSTLIQNAWINGCGVVLWENVFGTVNEVNPRDRSLLRSMLPIMRRYTDFFTTGSWFPLFPVKLNRVYASQWQLGNKTLWTIINRQEQRATGKLLEIDAKPGIKFFDLVAGKELKTSVGNGKVSLFANFNPKAIGCILAVPEAELTPDFYAFLAKQASTNVRADVSTTYALPAHQLKSVAPTKKYSTGSLPKGMLAVQTPGNSVTLTLSFRQREGGFYPIGNFVDYSYSQDRNELIKGNVPVKLTPFAIDETLVSNAQFADFLQSSSYKPAQAGNFLRHWVAGAPPKGQENHPVVWIALDDARAYAKWAGKRLPTEAEWQWVAQNGHEATPYPWGKTLDSAAVNTGQFGGTTPVTNFEKGKTRLGVYDMSGNVWQLTESERTDGYNTYVILRGGAWYVNRASEWYADQGAQQTGFGAKYLLTWPGLDRCATVGFRCVVDR